MSNSTTLSVGSRDDAAARYRARRDETPGLGLSVTARVTFGDVHVP